MTTIDVKILDARLKDLCTRLLLVELRSRAMNRPELLVANWSRIVVNRLTKDVEYASEAFRADRDHDWMARVDSFHAAHQAVRRAHGDAARDAIAKMLHDLDDEVDVNARLALDGDGIEDCRQLARREFNIYDRSDDLYDFTFCQW